MRQEQQRYTSIISIISWRSNNNTIILKLIKKRQHCRHLWVDTNNSISISNNRRAEVTTVVVASTMKSLPLEVVVVKTVRQYQYYPRRPRRCYNLFRRKPLSRIAMIVVVARVVVAVVKILQQHTVPIPTLYLSKVSLGFDGAVDWFVALMTNVLMRSGLFLWFRALCLVCVWHGGEGVLC